MNNSEREAELRKDVAKAAFTAFFTSDPEYPETPWEDEPDVAKESWLVAADAAIAAIRESDEEQGFVLAERCNNCDGTGEGASVFTPDGTAAVELCDECERSGLVVAFTARLSPKTESEGSK